MRTIRQVLHALELFQSRLLDWYHRHRRDLPWRPPRLSAAGSLPDPYYVLVSELMLQQTQVATVVPYFNRFIARFPTIADLANADEQEVLRLWQGLGYYSRARNLQQAARRVMSDHAGRLPDQVPALLELPGIGRYTAGAVASIAYGRPAPIVDGNVIRVLSRIDKLATDPRTQAARAVLWTRAEQIVPVAHAADFNSALMELGALVCTPRAPQCLLCPVRANCEAQAAGVQESIPPPKPARANPLHERWTFCIHRPAVGATDADAARSDQGSLDQWLLEQRSPTGRWAGMWQFVTIDAGTGRPTPRLLAARLPVRVRSIQPLATIAHALTHRRYRFDAFTCRAVAGADTLPVSTVARRWLTLDDLQAFPLPKPHAQLADLLRRRAAKAVRPPKR